jgi:hypothetical protein
MSRKYPCTLTTNLCYQEMTVRATIEPRIGTHTEWRGKLYWTRKKTSTLGLKRSWHVFARCVTFKERTNKKAIHLQEVDMEDRLETCRSCIEVHLPVCPIWEGLDLKEVPLEGA